MNALPDRFRGASFLAAVLMAVVPSAHALVVTTGDAVVGIHGSNLIANGSFETGHPAPGSNAGWTPGSHVGGYPGIEVAAIPSWTSSYPTGAYGWWGPLGFAGAPAPDGVNAVYFGNSFNSVGVGAAIAPNGVVTFAGVPTFAGRPGPVTLSQTVGGLEVGATYLLDFWTSGESNVGGFVGTGIFGLSITGESLTYLQLPASSNAFGASERFQVEFVATSASTTIEFLNWGHITDISGTGTELVLDDVILNKKGPAGDRVPDAGSSLLLLATALVGLVGCRRMIR